MCKLLVQKIDSKTEAKFCFFQSLEDDQKKDGLLYITKRYVPVKSAYKIDFDTRKSKASMALEVTSDTQHWLPVNNDPRWKGNQDQKWIEMVKNIIFSMPGCFIHFFIHVLLAEKVHFHPR